LIFNGFKVDALFFIYSFIQVHNKMKMVKSCQHNEKHQVPKTTTALSTNCKRRPLKRLLEGYSHGAETYHLLDLLCDRKKKSFFFLKSHYSVLRHRVVMW